MVVERNWKIYYTQEEFDEKVHDYIIESSNDLRKELIEIKLRCNEENYV